MVGAEDIRKRENVIAGIGKQTSKVVGWLKVEQLRIV